MSVNGQGQGISVGDAVLTFLGDTTTVDQAFDKTEARAQQWAGNVDAAISGTGESFAKAGTAATSFGEEAESAGEATGGSMREARGAIALMGEEIGIHVPRHLQTFIAGLPGVQAAMSAAFAPVAIFALIEIGSKLIEKIKEIAGHAQEVSEAWQKVQDDAESAFQHTGDEILRVEAQIDELNHDKLGALEKELELIDHASLADLSKQLQQIETDTDAAFTKMHTWWDWVTTIGQGNSGIEQVKNQFDEASKSLQNILKFGEEHPDPYATVTKSLDNARQHLTQLQAQQQKATGEQKSLIDEEVSAQQKRISALELLQSKGTEAQSALTTLEQRRLTLQQQMDEAVKEADSSYIQMAAGAMDALDKQIDAQKHSNESIGTEILLLMQSNKLYEDRVKLTTEAKTKSGGLTELQKENQSILEMQKTFGDAVFELQKQQDLQLLEQKKSAFNLSRATDQADFSAQLTALANLDLQKLQIEAATAEKEYQLELGAKQEQLKALQDQGSKTIAEQIKVGGEIEAMQKEHQAKLVATVTAGIAAMRQATSVPIPLVNEVPPGVDQISTDLTKAFDKAEEAAQSLGFTLQGDLNAALNKAFDDYSKLESLLQKGVVTQKDVDNGYIKLVQAQLDFAHATGASADQIARLQRELDQLTGKEEKNLADFGKRAHITWQQFTADLKAAKDGSLQAGLGFQEMKDFGIAAFDSLTQSFESAVASAIMGQESFGRALEKATAQALSQLAAQALVKALFYTAEGFAALASFDYSGAAEFFEAAGIMGAVGAAAGVAGHALAGAASSGSSASSGPGVGAPGKGEPISTASSSPEPVVNTTHFAAGGIVTSPMQAIVGDGPGGGSADEAIIPLSDRQAMNRIADALMPELMKAMGKSVYHDIEQVGGAPFFTPTTHVAASNPTALLSPSTVAAAAPSTAAAPVNHALDTFYKLMDGITHGKYSQEHPRNQQPIELHMKVETNIPSAVRVMGPELSKQSKNGTIRLHATTADRTIKKF
jgi:hypothetical protein